MDDHYGTRIGKDFEKDNKYAFKLYQTENGLKDLTAMYMTTDPKGGLWIVITDCSILILTTKLL